MWRASTLFITGGVRSGKSSYAEHLAIKRAKKNNLNLHYIACGIPFDQEMKERILRHQADRKQGGAEWTTWEKPVELAGLAPEFTSHDLILVDCLTTLLNNYFFEKNKLERHAVLHQIEEDVESLRGFAGEVILVSNEVQEGLPIQDYFTQNYQCILGNLHQHLAKVADVAILVESGIPVFKNGKLE